MANPYNFRGLLSPRQPMNMVGGIDPLRGQSLMGQPVRMPAASPMALQLQQRMQPQQGLLGRIGSGISSSIGDMGSSLARTSGRFFSDPSASARLSALGASLLQGPSREPISFGSSLAQGLLAGNIAAQQEEERRFKRGLLEQETDLAKERLGIEREKLDIERKKISPTAEIRTGFTVVYDNEGNEKPVEKYKDSLGNVSYRDASTKGDVDFTKYRLNKPEVTSEDFGTAKPYISKETGETEFIVERKRNGKASFVRQMPDGSFEEISLANYKEPVSKEEKAAAIPSTETIYKFGEEAMTTENSAAASLSFISDLDRAIKNQNFGLKGLVNNFTAKFKAATGQDLSEEEALRRLLSSKQAGIVGSSRVEILGPGVLSNQDIEFLFNAVGGRIDSLISDPRLMRELLLQNYDSKIKSYKFQSQKYNTNKRYLSEGDQPTLSPSFVLGNRKFNGFIDPDFFAEGGTTVMFMNMSPEDQQKVLIGFNNG